MAASDILAGLNKQQAEAVSAGDGPILVLAGPGSGKTRVLTHRIAYLVTEMGVPAWHIMAVTFTNRAAREMENRVLGLCSQPGMMDGLTIGTFHSICARILRKEADYTDAFSRDYIIYDTDDQLKIVKQTLAELNLDDKKHNPRAMLSLISGAKNELIPPEQYPTPDYRAEIVRRVYARYDELLQACNARDFDDLLTHTVRLFRNTPSVLNRYQSRYEHILVDEFQDTNIAQYTLIQQLAGQRRNLFAVGDPDQSIYAFRGADYRNVMRFRDNYPDSQMILLEQNYRSHQAILDAATGVIDQNPGRVKKELFSERKEGPLVMIHEAHNEEDEARYIVETITDLVNYGSYQPGDFAVMYRTNAQSRALEEGFLYAGLAYRLVGATRFYGRKEIKDVLAYLRLVHNPDDLVSLSRIINVPPRGIGQKTMQDLEQWAVSLGITVAQALFHLLDDRADAPFAGRARNALENIASQLLHWHEQRDTLTPAELMKQVLSETRYLDFLDDSTPEGQSRVENVLEFRGVAETYANLPLATFLEEVALVSDVDTRDDDMQAPSLLTLHAAKGLEFPVVFITGLEEGVLPHTRSMDDPSQMQEERRLMYVGLTRAEERVYLTYAFRRSLYGDSSANMPSRFLYDIPANVRDGTMLRTRGSSAMQRDAYTSMTTWDRSASSSSRRSRSSSGPSLPMKKEGKPKAPPPVKFKAGTCVWHKKYGEGVVVRSLPRGKIEEVDVLFPGIGQKTIISDFLSEMDK
ncbi:ATP-dependent helicase [Aggregatilinea lenta]|uniref:ATP-dependent helicase n=1 Tax=Aggregatilinea lenta TaxID=913108 RepID=UPI000E5B5397|nr:UvrD-helicase domain-containing protein [Aggregatilinea lenta]